MHSVRGLCSRMFGGFWHTALILLALLLPAGAAAYRYFTGGPPKGTNASVSAISRQPEPCLPSLPNNWYDKLPLTFEPNFGQSDGQVKFLSRGKGYILFLTAGGAVFRVNAAGPSRNKQGASIVATSLQSGYTALQAYGPPQTLQPEMRMQPLLESPGATSGRKSSGAQTENWDSTQEVRGAVLRMKLVGSNPQPRIRGAERLSGRSHYLIGEDPKHWYVNVPRYRKVHYQEVYPGVDLTYYGNQRLLEYDFIVAPGADPSAVRLGFEGADRMSIDEKGDLVLKLAGGTFVLQAPLAYQTRNGKREEILARYARAGPNEVSFSVGDYDRQSVLLIDPVVYSTFLGGSGDDNPYSIAVDSSGNAYVAGETQSANFPTASPFQAARGGAQDIFVTKFNSEGNRLIYSTYIGGLGTDNVRALAIDSSGNAHITGMTGSGNFPRVGAGQAQGGSFDAFFSKLNPSGSGFLYSTFLGGSNRDFGTGIAVDGAGNSYVTGQTESRNFPTVRPLQSAFGGGQSDFFVTKFSAQGSILYSTYLGGDDREGELFGGEVGASRIAVDSSGNAYLTGGTNSENFPVTRGALQPNRTPPPVPSPGALVRDAFISKINPEGSSLLYSTYLGGNGDDAANAIAIDAAGIAHVVGRARSANFPTRDPFQASNISGADAFIAKINATGTALVMSTYFGGEGFENAAFGIALDSQGSVYVVGQTTSPFFPLANPIQDKYGGPLTFTFNGDVYVAKFTSAGQLAFSTYLGGKDQDVSSGIAVDPSGNIYVTGWTKSTDFPTTRPFQSNHQGGTLGGFDGFVTKLVPNAGPVFGVSAGAFLPPVPDQSWTRFARFDSNGNGVPDPSDQPFDFQRLGNEARFLTDRNLVGPPGVRTLVFSDKGIQGRFQKSSRTFITFTGPQFNIVNQTTDTVRAVKFDAKGNPIEFEVTEQRTTPDPATLSTFKAALIDENSDGVYEAFTVEGSTSSRIVPKVTVNLVGVDVNNDGRADFLTIPWALASVFGKYVPPQVFVPLGDTDGDGFGDTVAFDYDNDRKPDPDLLIGPPLVSSEYNLFFAQFGDGAVSAKAGGLGPLRQVAHLFSQIMLLNLDSTQPAKAKLIIRDDAGNPLTVDLNNEVVPGEKELTIPPGGLRVLQTDGEGPVSVGSVRVVSDRRLSGVILFGGTIGLAGVGASAELSAGFVTPVESNSSRSVSTGIAVMNLENRETTLDLQLTDPDDRLVSTARLDGTSAIRGNGHSARFLQEFNWTPVVDFSNFTGLLKVTSSGRIAATVLHTQPGEFATLPAAPAGSGSSRLLFAQFGDGRSDGAQLLSKILLFDLRRQRVIARLSLRDDPGRPLSVDLNGEIVAGQKDVTIPPVALRILQTDGEGPLTAGSVTVSADNPVAGVLLFSGSLGVAGVGASAELSRGFVTPVENNTAAGISTGVAVMSLENSDLTADLELSDADGKLVATARLAGASALRANGHLARFLPEFDWTPTVNFSEFTGILKLVTSGKTAATVLQTRPGQFATLPVAAR